MTDGENRLEAGTLKTDRRGRVRSTVAQRQAVLAEFEWPGLSGPQFARVAGIAYLTLAGWVQRRRHERGKYNAKRERALMSHAPVQLVEAVFGAQTAGPPSAPGVVARRVHGLTKLGILTILGA